VTNLFSRFLREEQGQDLIEYAMLAGLISIASVLSITTVGTAINVKYIAVDSAVTAAS
jgi:pilus assembly protein Flp/PilA